MSSHDAAIPFIPLGGVTTGMALHAVFSVRPYAWASACVYTPRGEYALTYSLK